MTGFLTRSFGAFRVETFAGGRWVTVQRTSDVTAARMTAARLKASGSTVRTVRGS